MRFITKFFLLPTIVVCCFEGVHSQSILLQRETTLHQEIAQPSQMITRHRVLKLHSSSQISCSVEMPDSLVFDPTTARYSPNPFIAKVIVRDSTGQIIEPECVSANFGPGVIIDKSNQPLGQYKFQAMMTTTDRTVTVCFTVCTRDRQEVKCCGSTFIPKVPTQIRARGTSFPTETALEQNYPNPFGTTVDDRTVIEYSITEDARVELRVFDQLGKVVATLVDNVQTVGRYEVPLSRDQLDARQSGMYFYTLRTNGKIVGTRAMVVR